MMLLCDWLNFSKGVRSLKKTDLNPVYVLVKPPSLEVLVSLMQLTCETYYSIYQYTIHCGVGGKSIAYHVFLFKIVLANC